MKLKSFNYFVGLLIIFFYSPLLSEDKIDIWTDKKEIVVDKPKQEEKNNQENIIRSDQLEKLNEYAELIIISFLLLSIYSYSNLIEEIL